MFLTAHATKDQVNKVCFIHDTDSNTVNDIYFFP